MSITPDQGQNDPLAVGEVVVSVQAGVLFGRRAVDVDLDASVAMFADSSVLDVVSATDSRPGIPGRPPPSVPG